MAQPGMYLRRFRWLERKLILCRMFTKSAVALALVGSAAAFTGPTAMPLRTGVSSPLI